MKGADKYIQNGSRAIYCQSWGIPLFTNRGLELFVLVVPFLVYFISTAVKCFPGSF